MSKKIKETSILFGVLFLLKVGLYLGKVSFLTTRIIGHQAIIGNAAFIPLRFAMGYVFLWYAIDHISSGLEFNGLGNRLLSKIGVMRTFDFTTTAKIWGIIEVFITVSLVTGFYLDVSSLLATVFVFIILVAYYVANKSFLFRDLAIFGALLSYFLLSR